MRAALFPLLVIASVLFVVLNLSAGLIWVERRLLALWQDRYGPNRWARLARTDCRRLDQALPKGRLDSALRRQPVFVLAPAIVVATALLSFAVVPFAPGFVIADLNIGILFLLAMSSLGVYSVVLAGWSSNNKYALLGGIRAAAQMMSYEVFMGLSLLGAVALAGSFRITDIVEAQRRLWFVVPQFLGFVLFLIAGVAETRRLPFDLAEAESELVAGFHSEYSGMKFGMFFVGEYIGVILVSAAISLLFFGGWLGPIFPPAIWFAAKTMFFICFFILLRAALPRPRFDQLMSVGLESDVAARTRKSSGDRCRCVVAEVKGGFRAQSCALVVGGFRHTFAKRVTVQYPEQKAYLSPRYRGRIVLTRDPDGGERCVACNLCAVACPVACISLQATEDEHGRRYPEILPLISLDAFFAATAKRLALLTPFS